MKLKQDFFKWAYREKAEHEEKIVSLSVDQFAQELIRDEAKALITKLRDEEGHHIANLYHGTDTREVDCVWIMNPDFKFTKGQKKEFND